MKHCLFLFDFGHSSIRRLTGLICEYCSVYILENMHCSHFVLLQISVNRFMCLKLNCCCTGALRGPDSALWPNQNDLKLHLKSNKYYRSKWFFHWADNCRLCHHALFLVLSCELTPEVCAPLSASESHTSPDSLPNSRTVHPTSCEAFPPEFLPPPKIQ